MRISDYYQPFEKKIIIAVTNNASARLLSAFDRDIEEIEIINADESEEQLIELYNSLHTRLRHLIANDGFTEAIVCIPEVNKTLFTELLPADMKKQISDIVPKNLASMDIPHIVRILLEG